MQIEAGKYYRTRGGQKVGPMNVPPKSNQWSNAVIAEFDSRGWLAGGKYFTDGRDSDKDIIAEWTETDLTAITTPFGLLDPETQQALRDHGGPIEQYTACGEGWRPHVMHKVSYHPAVVYRVKPKPAMTQQVLYWSNGNGGTRDRCPTDTHKITITLEGDKPTAIKIEALE